MWPSWVCRCCEGPPEGGGARGVPVGWLTRGDAGGSGDIAAGGGWRSRSPAGSGRGPPGFVRILAALGAEDPPGADKEDGEQKLLLPHTVRLLGKGHLTQSCAQSARPGGGGGGDGGGGEAAGGSEP